jgi:hypothetical protein
MVPALPAGAIQLDGTGEPAALGRQIAQAVYGSFGSGGGGEKMANAPAGPGGQP